MSLRDDLLPIIDSLRGLMDTDQLDLRTNSITRRKITWSGPAVGIGRPCNQDLELTPRPKAVESGDGGLRVGPITPVYVGGGYSVADLLVPAQFGISNVEMKYVVSGPNGGEYALVDLETTGNFGYFLTLEPLTRNRPA